MSFCGQQLVYVVKMASPVVHQSTDCIHPGSRLAKLVIVDVVNVVTINSSYASLQCAHSRGENSDPFSLQGSARVRLVAMA